MRVLLTLLFLLTGCPKAGSTEATTPELPASEQALLAWAAGQLDMRTWNGCTRGTSLSLDGLHVVFEVDAEGKVTGPTFDPPSDKADPALLCLGMVWVKPPDMPPPDEATPVRLRVSTLLAQGM